MLINEVFGWLWIIFGFCSGMWMGLRFHDENWMGGYGSHPRRMIRLGHISFFGIGLLNILFAHSLERITLNAALFHLASIFFILGGMTMPLCCALMARSKAWQASFAIPVLSLNAAGILTLIGLVTL